MMKKKLYIFILMLLPALSFAQNEVYKRYSPQQDLTVAQVSGFALNDSVRVDVVLVVADDNAAWERVKKELKALGFSFADSKTNFIFAKHESVKAKELFEALKAQNIYVRYFNKPRIDDHLRISMGTDEQMDKVITFLKGYLNG